MTTRSSLALRWAMLPITAIAVCLPHAALAQDNGDDCRSSKAGLSCEVFCTEGAPRVPHAEISWKARSLPQPLRLELTVYKSGFPAGEFVVFSDLDDKGDPKKGDSNRDGRRGKYVGKDERDLAWKDLSLIDARGDQQPSVTIRNLEPNLVYRLRLVGSSEDGCIRSEEAVCRPVACVADWVKGGGK